MSHQKKQNRWTDQKKMKNDATHIADSAEREMLPKGDTFEGLRKYL